MNLDFENLYESLQDSFTRMQFVDSSDVPDIKLYMDQVTSFLDEKLKSSARYHDGNERLVTKTMINNYAKADVIPSPDKKRYNRDHVLLLIILYYFKSILQINDIKTLLDPIIEDYFGKTDGYTMSDVYDEIFKDMKAQLDEINEDVTDKYNRALESHEDAPIDKQDYLRKFDLICRLGCDVFVKKLIIEKTVDSLKDYNEKGNNKYEGKKAEEQI